MRPELRMARAEVSIVAARHHTLHANIGIQVGGMGPKAAFGLQSAVALFYGSDK